MIERDGYKIVLDYICPPVPMRCNDWEAVEADADDPLWDGEIWTNRPPVGIGATAEEAIQDLIRQLKERDEK
jgi:hypothetical protein